MLYLKEKRYIALQIACGDIIDVDIQNNTFIINTEEQIMYNVLTNETNKKLLQQALNWQGFNGDIVINKIDSKQDIINRDIEKLKNFGIDFKINKGE